MANEMEIFPIVLALQTLPCQVGFSLTCFFLSPESSLTHRSSNYVLAFILRMIHI